MANDVSLNFLTLNCWGIPLVSRNKDARMKAIADKLSTGEYDIICLQEVWSDKDFKMMRAHVQEKLPYSYYFYSGVLGSGLCILSRYPIEGVMFHKWPLNGYVHKIHHGDWFGGKGVGLCRVRIQEMSVHIYIVHLHAEYCRENDEYNAHRILQAFDTAQFLRMTSGGSDVVILGGDLNTEPQDLAYRIICGIAGLKDACSNSASNLGTNECANNSYTGKKLAKLCPEGKRIDHILYTGSEKYKIEVVNFLHPFPKRVPYKDFSYSDHEAIMASIRLTKGVNDVADVDVRDSLKEAIGICESALKDVGWQRWWYLLASCFLIIPLVGSMVLDSSNLFIGIGIALNFGRILLTAILCYTLFMSTLWNMVERNALKAGCLAMETHLLHLNNIISKK